MFFNTLLKLHHIGMYHFSGIELWNHMLYYEGIVCDQPQPCTPRNRTKLPCKLDISSQMVPDKTFYNVHIPRAVPLDFWELAYEPYIDIHGIF